ncbi:MAG: hypothetical protein CVU81_03150 [Euryarchaeota archaeon HGW-Euryarchaeota-1]|nr:MAG: hypothetical protein CVU81_03150 [Euryarchaeota archaeon HGW-Euryarchaeota-1]
MVNLKDLKTRATAMNKKGDVSFDWVVIIIILLIALFLVGYFIVSFIINKTTDVTQVSAGMEKAANSREVVASISTACDQWKSLSWTYSTSDPVYSEVESRFVTANLSMYKVTCDRLWSSSGKKYGTFLDVGVINYNSSSSKLSGDAVFTVVVSDNSYINTNIAVFSYNNSDAINVSKNGGDTYVHENVVGGTSGSNTGGMILYNQNSINNPLAPKDKLYFKIMSDVQFINGEVLMGKDSGNFNFTKALNTRNYKSINDYIRSGSISDLLFSGKPLKGAGYYPYVIVNERTGHIENYVYVAIEDQSTGQFVPLDTINLNI